MSETINNDIPHCSRCGELKPDNQLNGYDPFAPAGQKYAKAYCIKIAECKSLEAERTLEKVLKPYMYDSLKDFEEICNTNVNDSFKIGWNMARLRF